MACIQLEHNASTSLLHYYLAASDDVDAHKAPDVVQAVLGHLAGL